MVKRIAILGSTGSIGTTTLQVVDSLPEQLKVDALAAHSNIDLLEQQAKRYNPKLIAVYDHKKALELSQRLPQIDIVAGMEGLKAVASLGSVDTVVSAISGTLGLVPTVAAIEAKKEVALANKEALVSGGNLVMSLAKAKGVKLLPVDSEHSAIFQCLVGENTESLHRLVLTASGGPFLHMPTEELDAITPAKALNHPTWKMGAKITIDSSTLMNKGLEVIEAHWLFGVPFDQIDVVIHPQSIIHSMVEFVDGSIKAQMSTPSMVVPIQYALTYPHRSKSIHPYYDFTKAASLQFLSPDFNKFRCLKLAFDALKVGKSMPCYMNAANEVLVHRFLEGSLSWSGIGIALEELMGQHDPIEITSIDEILHVEELARQQARDGCCR